VGRAVSAREIDTVQLPAGFPAFLLELLSTHLLGFFTGRGSRESVSPIGLLTASELISYAARWVSEE
jgi:hypothetical protein